jgi:hypothetical protein
VSLPLIPSRFSQMYWKQVHKSGMIREVYTEGGDLASYFDKEELSRLFSIGPPNVCESIELFKSAQVTSGKNHEFILGHKATAGLFRLEAINHTSGSNAFGNVAVRSPLTNQSGLKRSAEEAHAAGCW